jgi:hypothetical protein
MAQFIFRMPAGVPMLNYASLRELAAGDVPASRYRRALGTTISLRLEDGYQPFIAFRLYQTTLAIIHPDKVWFTGHGDLHQATREWISKIIFDNGIGTQAFREKFTLYVDGDRSRPVEGHDYPVSEAGIEHAREFYAQWDALRERNAG